MIRILTLIAAVILTALPLSAQAPAPAPKITLAWDYGDLPGVTFRLYSKEPDGSWKLFAEIPKGREHALPALVPGIHTFAARAVLNGVESPNSNELPVLAPPSGLRWSVTLTAQ